MAVFKKSSRRSFLKIVGRTATASLAIPTFVPSHALGAPGRPGPNDRIGIGFIGVGGRGRQLIDHMPGDGRIVAISDAFRERSEDTNRIKKAHWKIYDDYRHLLEAKDIDAVVVATPDHGRVLPCIHACQAGKDIYAEKPLTLTIGEGRVLVDAVRKTSRVLQVGTQQRSMEINRFACEFVRNGGLGKLHTVLVRNYPNAGEFTMPGETVPEGLDWDLWCGQTELAPYHHRLRTEWMAHRRYSGGEMTNWGAHGLDQVQWALGTSHSGPSEIWPENGGPHGKISLRYANGVTVKLHLEDTGPMGGGIFIGEKGKIEINRNKFATNPKALIEDPPEPAVKSPWEGPGFIAKPHLQNWIDCIKTRDVPVADVEIGHRSVTICHLANIARQVGRKLAWDPVKEVFLGDDEANGLLDRPKRAGYELPDLTKDESVYSKTFLGVTPSTRHARP